MVEDKFKEHDTEDEPSTDEDKPIKSETETDSSNINSSSESDEDFNSEVEPSDTETEKLRKQMFKNKKTDQETSSSNDKYVKGDMFAILKKQDFLNKEMQSLLWKV